MDSFKPAGTSKLVYVMNKVLIGEWESFPHKEVKDEILRLVDASNERIIISSIKSGTDGRARTQSNGPNHASGTAIDVTFGRMISDYKPNLHRNIAFMMWMRLLYPSPRCRILIENDHVHFDCNKPRSLLVQTVTRKNDQNAKLQHCWEESFVVRDIDEFLKPYKQ